MNTTSKIIPVLLLLTFYGCKSNFVKQPKATKGLSIQHKKLEKLIEQDSTQAFYSLFKTSKFDPNHIEYNISLLFIFSDLLKKIKNCQRVNLLIKGR